MCYLLDYCKLHFYHHFSFFKKKICFIEFNLQILNCPYYFIQSFVCAFLDVSQVFIPVIFKFIHMFVSLLNSLNKFITILLNSLFSLGIIFMGLIIWVVAYSLFGGGVLLVLLWKDPGIWRSIVGFIFCYVFSPLRRSSEVELVGHLWCVFRGQRWGDQEFC